MCRIPKQSEGYDQMYKTKTLLSSCYSKQTDPFLNKALLSTSCSHTHKAEMANLVTALPEN